MHTYVHLCVHATVYLKSIVSSEPENVQNAVGFRTLSIKLLALQ